MLHSYSVLLEADLLLAEGAVVNVAIGHEAVGHCLAETLVTAGAGGRGVVGVGHWETGLLDGHVDEAGEGLETWGRRVVDGLLGVVPLDDALAGLRVGLWWRGAGVVEGRGRLGFDGRLGGVRHSSAPVHLLTGDVVVDDDLPGGQLLLGVVAGRWPGRVGVVLVTVRDDDAGVLPLDVARRDGRVSNRAVVVVHLLAALVDRERMDRRALRY